MDLIIKYMELSKLNISEKQNKILEKYSKDNLKRMNVERKYLQSFYTIASVGAVFSIIVSLFIILASLFPPTLSILMVVSPYYSIPAIVYMLETIGFNHVFFGANFIVGLTTFIILLLNLYVTNKKHKNLKINSLILDDILFTIVFSLFFAIPFTSSFLVLFQSFNKLFKNSKDLKYLKENKSEIMNILKMDKEKINKEKAKVLNQIKEDKESLITLKKTNNEYLYPLRDLVFEEIYNDKKEEFINAYIENKQTINIAND